MSGLTLTLKSPPAQRLNLAHVTPGKLKGKSEREIAAIPVGITREPVLLGDAFTLRMGDVDDIHIVGSTERIDHIGCGMSAGTIAIEGAAGAYCGCYLLGGSLTLAWKGIDHVSTRRVRRGFGMSSELEVGAGRDTFRLNLDRAVRADGKTFPFDRTARGLGAHPIVLTIAERSGRAPSN